MVILQQEVARIEGVQPVPNKQGSKCALCKKSKGVIPISDEEEHEFWICEKCESSMDWQLC